jgi:hypothetical protein
MGGGKPSQPINRACVIVTLALGIGSTTAIFSVVEVDAASHGGMH